MKYFLDIYCSQKYVSFNDNTKPKIHQIQIVNILFTKQKLPF